MLISFYDHLMEKMRLATRKNIISHEICVHNKNEAFSEEKVETVHNVECHSSRMEYFVYSLEYWSRTNWKSKYSNIFPKFEWKMFYKLKKNLFKTFLHQKLYLNWKNLIKMIRKSICLQNVQRTNHSNIVVHIISTASIQRTLDRMLFPFYSIWKISRFHSCTETGFTWIGCFDAAILSAYGRTNDIVIGKCVPFVIHQVYISTCSVRSGSSWTNSRA